MRAGIACTIEHVDGLLQLSGHAALVTGGGTRLGKAFTLGIARSGADVAVHYHSSAHGADEAAAEARRAGVRAVTLQADLADPEAAAALVRRAVEALGDVDLLVNNAAIFEEGGPLDTTLDTWRRHLDLNLTAPFLLTQALARHLDGRSGAVVNILDWRALRPGPDHLAYTVSKAALAATTRSLAQTLAPSLRVNAVAPGAILPPVAEESGPEALARIPSARWGEVDEVVGAVLFLLAGPAYITGEVLHVDGGRHLS